MTISHCIIAEGLDHSTHGKGAHSKGSLIHDNATDIAVIANLYASNGQRNPYFKGGARGVVVNNLRQDSGQRAGSRRLSKRAGDTARIGCQSVGPDHDDEPVSP